jgi:hypothetical protein
MNWFVPSAANILLMLMSTQNVTRTLMLLQQQKVDHQDQVMVLKHSNRQHLLRRVTITLRMILLLKAVVTSAIGSANLLLGVINKTPSEPRPQVY